MIKKHHLGRPVGGRGRSIEMMTVQGYFIVIILQILWDFDMRPLNRSWPLNGGQLNGDSTAIELKLII
jgi:hypothetical protein